MTDREPDDLYDALRDRLADYGQQPPAPLWAGIRAQLPPPVAAPQLRPRRKRRAAWLLVLLLVASVGGWQLWRTAGTGPAAANTGGLTATTSDARRTQAATSASLDATARQPAPAATIEKTGADAAIAARSGAAQPADISAVNRPASALASAKARIAASMGSTPAQPATHSGGVMPSGNLAANAAGRPAAVAAHRPTRNINPAKAADPAGKTSARSAAVAAETGIATTGRTAKAVAGRQAPATEQVPAGAASSSFAGARAGISASPGPAATTEPTQPAGSSPEGTVAAGRVAQAGAPRQRGTGVPAAPAEGKAAVLLTANEGTTPAPGATAGADAVAAWNKLPFRLAALDMLPLEGIAQPHAADYQAAAPVRAPRWAVQLLAGPALTYRHLSTASGLSYAAVTSVSPSTAYSASASKVADLERPAPGYGGQLTVRRVLSNDRWAVRAGLGYAEYGSRLAIQRVGVVRTAFNSNPLADSAGSGGSTSASIHRRDTYRFVTIPLSLSYKLRSGTRWQLGVVGGLEVAAYVGGTSTEGAPCVCQTQSWGATGSPYRRISVGANLGAELRYYLTDRWSLLAQPTATYFLNSLARPSTTYSQRHLLGGAALLGVSYDLP